MPVVIGLWREALSRLHVEGLRERMSALRMEVNRLAKNTGRGHRVGAVTARSEFKHGTTWFKRDTTTGRIMNGSPNQHKGVRNEK